MDGDDGLEGVVLRGRGGRRTVELNVAACGESCPAVKWHDHRRIDAQEFARGGKSDQIGFGTVAVPGTREGVAFAGKRFLRPVRKQENLSAIYVEERFRGGEGRTAARRAAGKSEEPSTAGMRTASTPTWERRVCAAASRSGCRSRLMRKAVTENEYSKSAGNLVSYARSKWKCI